MPDSRSLTASEAAAALGVSLPTLYAYVSRGLVRSEPAGGNRRDRRYRREDIDRMRTKQEQRRDPSRAAERALSWGMPVLDSALSLVMDGHLYYRGHDAVELASSSTFERVAELLWLGEEHGAEAETADAFEAGRTRFDSLRPWLPQLNDPTPVDVLQAVLPVAAAQDVAAYDLRPVAVAQTGGRILGLLGAAAVYPAQTTAGSMAECLRQGWRVRHRQAAQLLDAALILCADHELNTSAFTARCVASVRATPWQAVMAGLAALQGVRHGGYTAQVEALFDEVGAPARAGRVLGAWLKRGEGLPGFGHPLYPDGDPRAHALLAMAGAAAPRSRESAVAQALVREAVGLTGEHPTVDFALVVVARMLGLPRGAPLVLFALGRTAGWVAHAIEQYQMEAMIRPRARYVGEMPRTEP